MANAYAHINPAMLSWARGRASLAVEEAATAVGVKPETYQNWESGDAQPTFRQAQLVASALHAPFGYLFLSEAPEDEPTLPDLRTIGGLPVPSPSINLKETIKNAMQRQEWFVEFLQEQGAQPLPFVGRFNIQSSVVEVANDIRNVLGVAVEQGHASWEAYQRELIDASERAGVLVMRSGIVGNNTHRKLDVGEFRGFAISHPLAPIVFINSTDAPSARLFTLLHELAHIWLGSSGISNAAPNNTRREEIFCNAVAGEFLAPSAIFAQLWPISSPELNVRVAELARRFHVSRLVIIRRALDMGFVDRATYSDFYLAELAAFRNAEGGGGNFYRNAGAKNSARFAKAVIAEAFSGRLLLREAGRLLGVQPSKIREFAGQLGA
ncbi:XRE family transcriptional regulator [Comamonas fluminis]|uniref:XRE family transcriptional regulator n=1 Tax=Comamonas fluminis TaxID=2796366 RepID=UPI001FE63BCD|nr:XRE family transcriptional regulator [Comamonas fluminis]